MNTRRRFLKNAGMACAGFATPHLFAGAEIGKKKIPVGVQLYSFRKQGEKDFAAMIRKTAEIGFSGVEFAGYGSYADKPVELRKLLDDVGLKVFGTHTGYNLVMPDQIQKTIDLHKTLGCSYIIIPWIDPKKMETRDGVLKIAEELTHICDTVQTAGLYLGYHAHGGDFQKIEGGLTPWEILFDNTPKTFIQQMDVGNCLGGGGDPYKMIERYPGRSLSVHLKEHGGPAGAVFGKGTVDFKRVLALCESIGGTTRYIIEHESDPEHCYEAAKACLDYLKTLD